MKETKVRQGREKTDFREAGEVEVGGGEEQEAGGVSCGSTTVLPVPRPDAGIAVTGVDTHAPGTNR